MGWHPIYSPYSSPHLWEIAPTCEILLQVQDWAMRWDLQRFSSVSFCEVLSEGFKIFKFRRVFRTVFLHIHLSDLALWQVGNLALAKLVNSEGFPRSFPIQSMVHPSEAQVGLNSLDATLDVIASSGCHLQIPSIFQWWMHYTYDYIQYIMWMWMYSTYFWWVIVDGVCGIWNCSNLSCKLQGSCCRFGASQLCLWRFIEQCQVSTPDFWLKAPPQLNRWGVSNPSLTLLANLVSSNCWNSSTPHIEAALPNQGTWL